jgi:8-hydroxy-5-deazaflavin:NADPH oxidoreductase
VKVTIIGAGNMGRGIGTRAVAGGHDVELIDRNPEDARSLADELGSRAAPSDTINGDVVVLALPYEALAGGAAGQTLDVLIAGDDERAKQTVASLVESGGMRPIDVGPLKRARQLEQMGMFHIAIQETLGSGFASALKLHW